MLNSIKHMTNHNMPTYNKMTEGWLQIVKFEIISNNIISIDNKENNIKDVFIEEKEDNNAFIPLK